MSIHSTAIIHSSAKLGKDVVIEPYAVIGEDVTIGDRCHIMSHTKIEFTELGAGCVVYPQVSLGMTPQHLQYKGEKTKLIVGSETVFREGVTAHRGTALDKGVTKIGNKCFFMALSHIAHDCVLGNNVIMANAAQMAGHVHLGDNVFISTMVGLHQFIRVGSFAMISGGAMVPMDIAPFCTAQGDRATLKGLNLVGMKRGGLSRDSIKKVKEAYKTVFMSQLKLNEALTQPALQVDDPNVKMFKEFLSAEGRGFVRPELPVGSKKEGEPVA